MKKVWMLSLALITAPVSASELHDLKLDPQFEQYLTQPKMKRVPGVKSAAKSAGLMAEQSEIANRFASAILGITSPIPTDGEESPLYQEIRNNLEASHTAIGAYEVGQIELFNRQFNLGTSNYSGFSWQKPIGAIHIYADRQVTPPLLTDKWLVADTFTIEAQATTFLENLQKAGLTTLSNSEIGLYAGITFRRTYTYWHFANSYNEGLASDYGKVFLSFMRFNVSGINQMEVNEVMKKEDSWTMKAGGLIVTPPVYNISLSGGFLAEASHQNSVSVENLPAATPTAKKLDVIVRSKTAARAGATIDLQLNFFNLLKFSLLSGDMSYTYASGKEVHLTFTENQWQHINQNPNEATEFKHVLKGKGDVLALEPYISRLDDDTSTALEARGSILLWGRQKKTSTETIKTVKENVARVFFRNYSQSVKVTQNFLSRIFSAVIYKLFKLPMGASNDAYFSKEMVMEYEETHPQTKDPRVMRMSTSEKFSFVLNHSYQVGGNPNKGLAKHYINDVTWFLRSFTTVGENIISSIESKALGGPMTMESNLRVEKVGFEYFMKIQEDAMYGILADACESKKKAEWTQAKKRKNIYVTDSANDICVQDLADDLTDFKKDYVKNRNYPSLAKFKKFVTSFLKRAENITYLKSLFGADNTFHHGRLSATSQQGSNYVTTFSNGQFRGLGVIDNYNREGREALRAPAAALNE